MTVTGHGFSTEIARAAFLEAISHASNMEPPELIGHKLCPFCGSARISSSVQGNIFRKDYPDLFARAIIIAGFDGSPGCVDQISPETARIARDLISNGMRTVPDRWRQGMDAK